MYKFSCEACSGEWFIPQEKKSLVQACPFCLSPVAKEEEIVVDCFEKAILKAVRELGVDCLKERGRFIGYLQDTASEYKKEIRILSNACDAGVLHTFYSTRSQDRASASKVFAQVQLRMVEEEGIAEQWAKLVCDSLLNAIHPEKKTTPAPPQPYPDHLFEMDGTTLVKYYGNEEEVVIPEGVTRIRWGTFSHNNSLRKVTMPSSLVDIDELAFPNCSALSEIVFSSGLEWIGSWAFSSCEFLKKVHLPDSLRFICPNAFSYCYSLEEIHLPRDLISLFVDTFQGCDNIKIVVASTTTKIPRGAFPPSAVIHRK